MAPLLDPTKLDRSLIESAREAVEARRTAKSAGLSEKGAKVRALVTGSDAVFDGRYREAILDMMGAVLGENLRQDDELLSRVGRMVVPTTSVAGYEEGSVLLLVGDYGITADGQRGEAVPKEVKIADYAREATPEEVETFFKNLAMSEATRAALTKLVLNATGVSL